MPSSPTIEQYDVSLQERRNIEERAKIRTELRKEFLKQSTNPHRHGQGGFVFDPALQRWQSARAQEWHWFKNGQGVNPRTLIAPLIVFATCFGYGHLLHVRRAAREADYRAGKVAYKDRGFKFV